MITGGKMYNQMQQWEDGVSQGHKTPCDRLIEYIGKAIVRARKTI